MHFVVLVLILLSRTVFASDSAVGRSCDLTIVGSTDKEAFLRFDKELRSALYRHDVTALALLVNLPLRINYSDGS
jgi:hypothetical protein